MTSTKPKHVCKGVKRSPRGDRLLVAIATDHNNQELKDALVAARQLPCYAGATDQELMAELEALIVKVPRKCPDCDGPSD